MSTTASSMDAMMSAMSTMSSHMSSMSKAMASMTTAPSASSMAGMSMPMSTGSSSGGGMGGMGGMHMGGGDDECVMDMIWNWNTINSCFLSRTWHVKTSGQFAGTCIGVFLWVVFLCVLSRARRSLDSYVLHNGSRKLAREEMQQGNHYMDPGAADARPLRQDSVLQCTTEPLACDNTKESTTKTYAASTAHSSDRLLLGTAEPRAYRPNVFEQLLRALLYGLEYSITWLLALIIMSYNGYVIVSAFLGATIGFMIVDWQKMRPMAGEPYTTTPVCC